MLATTTLTARSKNYFPALTGLRAMVAFLVFFYHYVKSYNTEGFSQGVKWAIRLVQQGHVGVSVFFVLSGFLITNRYYNGIELTAGWFRRYLQNRLARIYPIYLLLTILTFAVMLVRPQYDWDEWGPHFSVLHKVVSVLLNLTLTRAYFEGLWLLGVGTAWSLTIEESFYLCAPLLLLGLRHDKWRFLFYPVMLLTIGTLLVGICQSLKAPYGLMGDINFMLCRTFFGRCFEFFVGIGLAFWLARPRVTTFSRVGLCTWLGVAGISVCIAALAINEHRAVSSVQGFYNVYIPISNLLLPLPVAVLLWGLIFERTWLQWLLQTKLFDLLGKSSYVFYLIHQGVIDDFFATHFTNNWLAKLVAYVLLSIGLYKLVEAPLHSRLKAKPLTAISSTVPTVG
jgi:peptidoglycan/LPS O-acetylase OafA/YrhL